MSVLTQDDLKFWDENGFLVLESYFASRALNDLTDWVRDLEARPEAPGKWMKYFEAPKAFNHTRLLCRVENFLPFHDDFHRLLCGPELLGIVSQLMGEEAVLFKEKINYKLPGGAGFAPHQDAPAFLTFGQRYHITLMVGIDAATPENGCLEVVRGRHKEGLLPRAPDQTIHPEVSKSLDWEFLPTSAGDVVLFDSYIPHRSGPNRTEGPRRALYITYNRKSEGERRDDYYAEKRRSFPPECERIPGRDYSAGAGIYNVGNPIAIKG